jgi:uncharacterized SAM-binding protein YcdF (DUF218 family)
MHFIIVLGNSNDDVVKKRVMAAFEYYKNLSPNEEVKIIFSGGGKKSVYSTEADIMYYFATNELKINPEKCIIENKSMNTYENIRFSIKLLKDLGWFNTTFASLTQHTFTICTSTFHIKRALLIAMSLIPKNCNLNVIHTNEEVLTAQHNSELFLINEYLNYLVLDVYSASNNKNEKLFS